MAKTLTSEQKPHDTFTMLGCNWVNTSESKYESPKGNNVTDQKKCLKDLCKTVVKVIMMTN